MPAREEKSLSVISKIGIIAGAGALPRRVALACKTLGIEPFVVAFKGQADADSVQGLDHVWLHMGAAGRAMEALKKKGVSDIVMIGAMRRPSLSELRPDLKTAAFFARVGMRALGDDGFLKTLRRFLEEEGFRIHGAHEFMPELLAPQGILGRHKPEAEDWRDIKRGIEILRAMGTLDIGQAVIVQNGIVLGVEAAEGTDGLIRRCADLRRKGHGGVLVKLCKPGQDRDLDLPTTGPQTIKNLVEAGFSGLAIHAGHSLLTDIDGVVELADAGKVFVVGVDPEQVEGQL